MSGEMSLQSEYVTSAPPVGLAHRSYDRLSNCADRALGLPQQRNLVRDLGSAPRQRERQQAKFNLASTRMPLKKIGHMKLEGFATTPNGNVHVCYGRNGSERGQRRIANWDKVRETFMHESPEPIQTLDALLTQGYHLSSRIHGGDVPRLVEMWHDNFGWEEAGVWKMIARLEQGTVLASSARSNEDGSIHAITIAEPYPLIKGGWEASEFARWSGVPPDVKNLSGAALIGLCAQANDNEMFIAEVNPESGAPQAAHLAGFSIPAPLGPNSRPTNMLVDHVEVGGALRSFVLVQHLGYDLETRKRIRSQYLN